MSKPDITQSFNQGDTMENENDERSPAEAFFTRAQSLREGTKILQPFSSKKEANAFRVSLYRIRQRKNDFTITIAMNENVIACAKNKKSFEVTFVNELGEEETEVLTVKSNKDMEEERLKEIRYRPSLQEIIDFFNSRVRVIESSNDYPHIKKIELGRAFDEHFKHEDKEYIKREVFISRHPDDGRMSYARLRTKEERDEYCKRCI